MRVQINLFGYEIEFGLMYDCFYRKGLFNRPSYDTFYAGKLKWFQWYRIFLSIHDLREYKIKSKVRFYA